jgi:hypothetical protein
MENRNRVFAGASISSLAVALSLWSGSAHAAPNLCSSVGWYCDYAGPEAPLLLANVCWNGTVATLKGTAACPVNTRAYWVDHGTIDPATGVVLATIALKDACTVGWCSTLAPNQTYPTEGGEVCCQPEPITGTCTLEVADCAGEILWCEGYEANNDGTIECMEAAS